MVIFHSKLLVYQRVFVFGYTSIVAAPFVILVYRLRTGYFHHPTIEISWSY